MCGRFTLRTVENVIFDEFDIKSDPRSLFGPRYNIAPTQNVAGVRLGDGGRELIRDADRRHDDARRCRNDAKNLAIHCT